MAHDSSLVVSTSTINAQSMNRCHVYVFCNLAPLPLQRELFIVYIQCNKFVTTG